MKNKRRSVLRIAVLLSFVLMPFSTLFSQERVYLSTDKECYVAGEPVWLSLYCTDESGEVPYLKGDIFGVSEKEGSRDFSRLSKMAVVEFHSNDGMAGKLKVALEKGRGCARFMIPFSFATGNYSVIAYTRRYGGNSVEAFNGKIITIFNTLTNKRVKDGVEILEKDEDISAANKQGVTSADLAIEIPGGDLSGKKALNLKLHNLGERIMSLSVSVYHNGELERRISGYNSTSLMERSGNFEETPELDYEGETIRAKISLRDEKGVSSRRRDSLIGNRNVYVSSVGALDEVYISQTDSLGYVKYYTNNMYGNRDLVFEVSGWTKMSKITSENSADSTVAYNVELVDDNYDHKVVEIPQLKISPALNRVLSERSMRMQLALKFEADTLWDYIPTRKNPLLSSFDPIVYYLDDYTRFPTMVEVISEYVKRLRVRKFEKRADIQVAYMNEGEIVTYSDARSLVLLDGVPVRDHNVIMELDPLLVEKILIYTDRYAAGNFIYDGIVEFSTYKGNMAGVKLGKNVSIIDFEGVRLPVALYGTNLLNNSRYPNYNSTIYWNPVVTLPAKGSLELDLALPDYKGDFKVVLEGMDSDGNGVYYTGEFTTLGE